MDTQKLKRILSRAQQQLDTQPYSLLQGKDSAYSRGAQLQMVTCMTCDDVRRQNYQLKQQMYEFEEQEIRFSEAEKQLVGVRELYALKCQQAELLRRELSAYKDKLARIQTKASQFCLNAAEGINRKLKDMETNPKSGQLY